ncbi:MAG: hypothetical protein ACI8Z9_000040 [Paraglaciecola sp.]
MIGAKLVEFDLDETSGSIDTFSHTLGKTGVDEGLQAVAQEAQLDLSDVLAQSNADSLDVYLGLAGESDNVTLDLELGDDVPIGQHVVLEKAGVESEDSSSTYVTNGLLEEGGIIISDAFAAPQAPSPEFDTQDL